MAVVSAPSLEVRQIVHAPPARVYDAWTTAADLTRWFAPSDEFTAVAHELDVRVGGRYRIEMRHRDGTSHVVTGEYLELARPERLSFTWRWEARPMEDTVVAIALHPHAAGTEVVLTHTRFGDEGIRDEHAKGWGGCLARLAGYVAG
jgi:uncharacterized protein YndB with AHSA1/START domain